MQFLQTLTEKVSPYKRKLATTGIAMFAAYLAFHVMFGANGMVQYGRKRSEYRRLQIEVQQMQAENARLEQQIKSLKTDPKTIEKEAREQLKYARPGEVVYVLPAPRQDVNTATAEKK